MTKRQQFIDYVKHGGGAVCSPQIGAGAGFDTRLAGKEWVSQTTFQDTLDAMTRFDILPLLNIGCPYESALQGIGWERTAHASAGDRITSSYILETAVGSLTRQFVETKREGTFSPKYPVTSEADLPALEYYIDALADCDFAEVTNQVRLAAKQIDGSGALSVQWAVQPYELFCFPNTVDTVMLHHDCPERTLAMMDKIVEIDRKLFRAVAAGGGDFIFLGAPAAEMLSPRIYESLIIPYSQTVTAAAHDCGLMVYSHICSPVEPFLTMGFYNRMGIDLFETLSPPPVGNVVSLKDALQKIDPAICTRGNIGLDVLLNGTAEQVRAKALEVLEASRGRKHMVAASDYLFYHTPEENIHAMAAAVREFNS
jgi:hypothetical protein